MIERFSSLIISIRYTSGFGYFLIGFLISIYDFFRYKKYLPDKYALRLRFKQVHGYKLKIESPLTFNEKMQWLKLYDRRPLHKVYADKSAVRKIYAEKFDSDNLVPLVFSARNWEEIALENMPDYPVIIKPNHASGYYHIIRDKYSCDWNMIRTDCRRWLSKNYYYSSREWQYKDIERLILVEKLLLNPDGSIPNNYRVHCFSGEAGLLSVNIYRKDTRHYIAAKFNRDLEYQDFHYGTEDTDLVSSELLRSIPKPASFEKMIMIAENLARDFAYLRVDFFEIDGKMFHGEVTFHDSGGFDKFIPFEWDLKFGKMIDLNYPNVR